MIQALNNEADGYLQVESVYNMNQQSIAASKDALEMNIDTQVLAENAKKLKSIKSNSE